MAPLDLDLYEVRCIALKMGETYTPPDSGWALIEATSISPKLAMLTMARSLGWAAHCIQAGMHHLCCHQGEKKPQVELN